MVPSYSSFRRNQAIEPRTPWWIFDDGCHDDVLRVVCTVVQYCCDVTLVATADTVTDAGAVTALEVDTAETV